MSERLNVMGQGRWKPLTVAFGAASITTLEVSKVNVALPSIEDGMGAGSTELQLIVVGYSLAFALALVPAGRLGDLHSRRIMILLGLSLFTLASLACALAPNIATLIIARVVQGVGAGLLMPQIFGLIQELFAKEERGRAFGVLSMVFSISLAVGPALGGFLITLGNDSESWRMLFWVGMPMSLLVLGLGLKYLPGRKKQSGAKLNLDLVGISLLAVTVFGLLVPFVLTTGAPTDDPLRWFWLFVFVGGLIAFINWEIRYKAKGKTPVVDFALFGFSSFRVGNMTLATYFVAIPGIFLLITLYLQSGLGVSAVVAGLVMVPFAIAAAISAWYGGRLVSRLGPKMIVGGLVVVILALLGMVAAALLAPAGWMPVLFAALMCVVGAGEGFVISPSTTLILSEVPVRHAGAASSVAQLVQRIGSSVGIAMISATFFAIIFQENAGGHEDVAYTHGFNVALLLGIGIIIVALLLRLLDLGQRSKPGRGRLRR